MGNNSNGDPATLYWLIGVYPAFFSWYATQSLTSIYELATYGKPIFTNWNDNSVFWYDKDRSDYQLNWLNREYKYIAFI